MWEGGWWWGWWGGVVGWWVGVEVCVCVCVCVCVWGGGGGGGGGDCTTARMKYHTKHLIHWLTMRYYIPSFCFYQSKLAIASSARNNRWTFFEFSTMSSSTKFNLDPITGLSARIHLSPPTPPPHPHPPNTTTHTHTTTTTTTTPSATYMRQWTG